MELTAFRREWRFLTLLLVAGLALRLLWLGHAEGTISGPLGSAEGSRVALAFAQGRGIADAYYQGYGPTAHLMPISPAIAGFIMELFGPESAAASLLLLGWCLTQVAAAYVLLWLLFRRLGADAVVTRWGLALLCLITPFAPQETIDFRYWEGALALCFVAANLLVICRLDARPELNMRGMSFIALLFAITLFLSPPAALAVGACWGVVALRQLNMRSCIQLATLTAVAIAAIITPWAVRNDRLLGAPVLLRSNFGIELALANHPGALSDAPPERVFADRSMQIHPFQASAKPPFKVQPGGEVAYSRMLAEQTWSWIRANPADFAKLYVRHLSEFFFPRPWQMYFTGWSGMRAPRAIAMSAVSLFGLIGLALGLYQRRRGYWIPALYIAAISLPYALFEPTARYIYLAYGPLAFLAIDGLVTAWRLCFGSRSLPDLSRRHVQEAEVVGEAA